MLMLKNLRGLISNSRLIFGLIIICVSVSTLVIQFSYGIYQNYHVTIEMGESEQSEIEIEFVNKSDDFIKLKDIIKCVGMFSPELYNSVDFCSVSQEPWRFPDTYDIVDEEKYERFRSDSQNKDADKEDYIRQTSKDIMMSFSFDDSGRLINPRTLKDNFEINHFIEGRWFKDDEFESEKVCIIGLGNTVQRIPPLKDEKGKDVFNIDYDGRMFRDNFTDQFGDTYRIIGCNGLGATLLPINCANGDYRMDDILIQMKSPITFLRYSELREVMEGVFGDRVKIPDMVFEEQGNTYLYRTILLICGLVSAAAGINFIILFQFIMMKRRKKFAVFRLCGCSRLKCVAMCLSECLLLTVPLYILFTLVYDKLIVPAFSGIYPYMQAANSLAIYIALGALYICITTAITLLMLTVNIHKPITEVRKGGW